MGVTLVINRQMFWPQTQFNGGAFRPLRLTQLDPNAIFAVHLLNRDKVHPLSRGNLLLKSQELQASGAWLMAQGLNLPYAVPSSIWVIEGRKLSL